MSARPLHVMLMEVVVVLSIIAPVPTFADFEKTEWDVQALYKNSAPTKEVLIRFFVWNLFQP
jgi:hypothetical protein